MWVVVEFTGKVNANGVLLGMEFGDLKKVFRGHLDSTYDHHLLLNKEDPWAQRLMGPLGARRPFHDTNPKSQHLPGLQACDGDPTTENISKWIGEWATDEFGVSGLERVKVEVWETQVNSATWEADV
jgi:6-pyruvoyl-tetrahydropterin synthase